MLSWLALVLTGPAVADEKIAPCASNCLAGIAETLAAAMTSADVEKACSVYVKSDDDILAIESSGRLHEGIEGIRDMYRTAFAEAKFLDVRFEFERTHLEETYGISYFKLRATLQTQPDGLKWEFYVQGSWVLRKTGERWLIEHEHFSPIIGVDRIRPLDPQPDEPSKTPDGSRDLQGNNGPDDHGGPDDHQGPDERKDPGQK